MKCGRKREVLPGDTGENHGIRCITRAEGGPELPTARPPRLFISHLLPQQAVLQVGTPLDKQAGSSGIASFVLRVAWFVSRLTW
jgi:hypothetical protein